MKFLKKSKIKRMGYQMLAALLGVSVLWGAGNVNPALFEKTRDALSTSTDIKWVVKKAEDVKSLVKWLGAKTVD